MIAIAACSLTAILGCTDSQSSQHSTTALPAISRQNYSEIPNPEPPEDYAAMTGVSAPDAPNEKLLGWLGHLDPEDTELEPIAIDIAAIESLRTGAELFDCGPYIFNNQLRDAIKDAPNLKWLRAGRKTKPADLDWICNLTQLQGLSLKHAELSIADLSQLEKLSGLKWLVLSGASLPLNSSLPKLPNLESLHMRYCDIGDSYAPTIGQYPRLRAVSMADTKVSDLGIRRLVAANPELRYLHLFGCKNVSRKSAPEIGKLKQLRYTHLGHTPLSSELYENWSGGDGLPRLQVLIPNCYIGIGS
jgi:Leucine-rich repeat (LRR) protein